MKFWAGTANMGGTNEGPQDRGSRNGGLFAVCFNHRTSEDGVRSIVSEVIRRRRAFRRSSAASLAFRPAPAPTAHHGKIFQAWEYLSDAAVVWSYTNDDSLTPRPEMFCISCGFKNPDEARFCMKCGVACASANDKAAALPVAARPVGTPQPSKENMGTRPSSTPAPRPAARPQPASGGFDADRFFASFAVGLGSIVLALILAGIGYHLMQAQTQACSAAILSRGVQTSCYTSGFWPIFLLAFAVASGGLKMASRIGKK
jgi:zinc ribbon protein